MVNSLAFFLELIIKRFYWSAKPQIFKCTQGQEISLVSKTTNSNSLKVKRSHWSAKPQIQIHTKSRDLVGHQNHKFKFTQSQEISLVSKTTNLIYVFWRKS